MTIPRFAGEQNSAYRSAAPGPFGVLRRIMVLIGVLPWLPACSRTSSTPVLVSAPVPKPTVKLAAGTARYRGVSRVRVEQQNEGQGHASEFEVSYYTGVTLVDDSGGLQATMVWDSIVPHGASPLTMGERAGGRGRRFTGRFTPGGRLADFVGDDSMPSGRLRQLAVTMRDFFPRIPAGGLEAGQEWTDTTEDWVDAAGVVLTTRSIDSHRVSGWSVYDGHRAFQIQVSTTYTLSGVGQQSGQPLSVEGTGVRIRNQFLAADGRYLAGTSADTATLSVVLAGLGLVLPGREIRSDTVLAVPQ